MREKKKPYIALKHRLARERRRQAEKAVYDKKTLVNRGYGFPGQKEEAKKRLDKLNEKAKITEKAPKGSVWLSPTNAEVDTSNSNQLKKIKIA